MPESDDESQEALKRLQERLDALSATRAPKESGEALAQSSAGEGYRLLGEVIGGVVGGLGIGWAVGGFFHAAPIGAVVGILLGTAVSGYVAVKSADRMGARGKAGRTETTKR